MRLKEGHKCQAANVIRKKFNSTIYTAAHSLPDGTSTHKFLITIQTKWQSQQEPVSCIILLHYFAPILLTVCLCLGRIKNNKTKLANAVFRPVEDARMARLSERILAVASSHKEPLHIPGAMEIETEKGALRTIAASQIHQFTNHPTCRTRKS